MAMPVGNNPVRSSERSIKPTQQYGAGTVYIEGHGQWEGHHGHFVVGAGTEIVIYTGIGVGLDNTHGESIARGEGLPSRLPTLYDNANGEYDTEPAATGGAVRANTSGTRVYRVGERCPNLTLYAPNEPGLPEFVAQPGSFSVRPGQPIDLLTIVGLYAHSREPIQFHWAACTVTR
jgi:hypothetical protein